MEVERVKRMTTDQIKAEMENIQTRLMEWEQERTALDAKITPARQELEFWNGILRIRQGEEYAGAVRALTGIVIDPAITEASEGYGAKSNGLRSFIRDRAATGVTLSDLKAEAVRLGAHPNMAYRLVTRLSDETVPPELERKDGRIYPTAHLKGE
jgi:hypothetical protein